MRTSPPGLDFSALLRHLIRRLNHTQTKEGQDMFYQTEAKPQGWRDIDVFDDRHDCLLYLGRSYNQVRAYITQAYFDGLGGAQWHAQHGPEVVLELAGLRPLDRPVPRVMDARRHLVGDQPPFVLEELDGEHPDVVQRVEHPAGVVAGPGL